MANNKQVWTYEEFWGSLRKIDDPETYRHWCEAFGFAIPEPLRILIQPRLRQALDTCSALELEQILTGAPVELTALYIHKLPVTAARRILKRYRIEDARLLDQAYYRPPQITSGDP